MLKPRSTLQELKSLVRDLNDLDLKDNPEKSRDSLSLDY